MRDVDAFLIIMDQPAPSDHPAEGAFDDPTARQYLEALLIIRATEPRLTRLSDRPMMTQTRYGSPFNALDLRGTNRGRGAKVCRRHDANAPFLWLDNRHLLAVQMPEGQNSALFTQYGRPAEYTAQSAHALSQGREATVDVAVSSQPADAGKEYTAEIVIIDVETGSWRLLATVPAFPFMGMLSLAVSPNGQELAILAPVGMIPPHELGPKPGTSHETPVVKQLGVVALDGKVPPRWMQLPLEARYPLDLLGWSPDSAALALRARTKATERTAQLFTLDAARGMVRPVAPKLVIDTNDAWVYMREDSTVWLTNRRLLVHGRERDKPGGEDSWWLVEAGKAPRPALAPGQRPGQRSAIPSLPPTAEILTGDERGTIWQDLTLKGLFLRETPSEGGEPHELLALNEHLAGVDWG